jgi:hypothetical protein
MQIEFESGANFITARNDDGSVEIRCQFRLTDCGDAESLDAFVQRHGGPEATAEYLKQRYRDQ